MAAAYVTARNAAARGGGRRPWRRPLRYRRTVCEFKGVASHFDAEAGGVRARAAAWTYRQPVERYAALRDLVSFHPGRVDAPWLDDEAVELQGGDFYGGWITPDFEGPFKH